MYPYGGGLGPSTVGQPSPQNPYSTFGPNSPNMMGKENYLVNPLKFDLKPPKPVNSLFNNL